MSIDDICEDLADLRLQLIVQGTLLSLALTELTETSPVVRSALEDLLWQAEVGQLHFGEDAKLVNAAMPDVYAILREIITRINLNLAVPLTPHRHVSEDLG